MIWPKNSIELSDEERTAIVEELRRRCGSLIEAGKYRIPCDVYDIVINYIERPGGHRYSIVLQVGYLDQDVVFDDSSQSRPLLPYARLALEKVLPALRKQMVLNDLSDV